MKKPAGDQERGVLYDSFKTALAAAATAYVEVPVGDGTCGLHIRWSDAISSATITLESSNEPDDKVASDSVVAGDWCAEAGVSITGPTAAAAGASMTHLGNVGARRLRLKIVAAADSKLRIRSFWKVN